MSGNKATDEEQVLGLTFRDLKFLAFTAGAIVFVEQDMKRFYKEELARLSGEAEAARRQDKEELARKRDKMEEARRQDKAEAEAARVKFKAKMDALHRQDNAEWDRRLGRG